MLIARRETTTMETRPIKVVGRGKVVDCGCMGANGGGGGGGQAGRGGMVVDAISMGDGVDSSDGGNDRGNGGGGNGAGLGCMGAEHGN